MSRGTVAAGLLLLIPALARAQPIETIGARALGMGGAFVAVADDATATYWNPAGLATGPYLSILLDREFIDLVPADPTPGARESRAATIALGTPPFGFTYYRLRATQAVVPPTVTGHVSRNDLRSGDVSVSSLVTHHTGVTLVQSLTAAIAAGATFRLIRGNAVVVTRPGADPDTLLDQASELTARASTSFDVDVGLMAGTGRVRLGLLARNLREARFKAPENGQVRLQRQVRVGVAVLPDPDFTVALDFDLATADEVTGRRRNVAIGAEKWWSNRRFGGRAGLRASAVGDGRPVVAGGLSVGIRPRLFLEGQITRGRADADRGWGLSLSSKF